MKKKIIKKDDNKKEVWGFLNGKQKGRIKKKLNWKKKTQLRKRTQQKKKYSIEKHKVKVEKKGWI